MVRSPAKVFKNEAEGRSGLFARICKDGECLFGLRDLNSSMAGPHHCSRYPRIHP